MVLTGVHSKELCILLSAIMIDAGILNAHIAFKLDQPESKLTHAQFQRRVAFRMVRIPAGQCRKRLYSLSTENPAIPHPDHEWIRAFKEAILHPM